jgi:hypothetical protein
MFQTPWMKDLGTAPFAGVSKEKPRGGSDKKQTWELFCRPQG